jgi:hypothetical protein
MTDEDIELRECFAKSILKSIIHDGKVNPSEIDGFMIADDVYAAANIMIQIWRELNEHS